MKETTEQLVLTLADGREVKGFFLCLRIRKKDTPAGYRKYDLRYSDANDADIAEVKDIVLVNHFGTFLTKEAIDGSNEGVEVTDWNYDDWTEETLSIEI